MDTDCDPMSLREADSVLKDAGTSRSFAFPLFAWGIAAFLGLAVAIVGVLVFSRPVEVSDDFVIYSSRECELFVNGRSFGRIRSKTQMRLEWGALRARLEPVSWPPSHTDGSVSVRGDQDRDWEREIRCWSANPSAGRIDNVVYIREVETGHTTVGAIRIRAVAVDGSFGSVHHGASPYVGGIDLKTLRRFETQDERFSLGGWGRLRQESPEENR